jgi:polyhydroxyalkanoate synthase subunit PhaC
MTEGRAGNGGDRSEVAPQMAPLDLWGQWLMSTLGEATATPGASVPWLASPGISTGEEARPLPEGTIRNDPLLSTVEKLWDANPLHNLLPINWAEIIRALQTLWAREMRDPARAMQRATEYNRQLFETTVEIWTDAAARFWGLPRERKEEDGASDKRFSASEWESNPFYQTLKESYLLASDYLMRETDETDGKNDEEQRRLKFHLKQFVDAMAPVNFLLTNPEAMRRIMETGGASLAEGTRNLLADLKEGRLSMTDATAFEVGKDIAITPGKVVYRNELIELIQYKPQTEQVYEIPVLFIPPWINKYYILDLRPQNSMVRYLLEQGFQVFMISWKNPDASLENLKFDEYMTKGPLAAAEVVRDITGSEKINPVGYCVGGTLLAIMLAWLAAGEEPPNPFNASTFMVALQDFTEVGETSVFIDEPQIEFMEQQMMERGYLDNRKMANMFNLLRSNDLIWSNVVNNYLLGQKPPAFDLLYWNADGTRMAREAHSFYLRNTYLENNFIKPGKVEINGRPIDLGKIGGEIYAVGAERDHIVPWKSAWRIGQLASKARTRFALASSGHIAGMINPPSKGKGRHWVNESGDAGAARSAGEWRENATEHEGSWWADWVKWLEPRSGEKVEPPGVGNENYPPAEDGPGTYVREK